VLTRTAIAIIVVALLGLGGLLLVARGGEADPIGWVETPGPERPVAVCGLEGVGMHPRIREGYPITDAECEAWQREMANE